MISFIINGIVLQDGADVGLISKVVSHPMLLLKDYNNFLVKLHYVQCQIQSFNDFSLIYYKMELM